MPLLPHLSRAGLCLLSCLLAAQRTETGAALGRVEQIAGGFAFTEGPVWNHQGYLLFSDIPNNVIRKWTPDGVSIFREHSGYAGTDAPAGAYIGSNGLTIDRKGRLTICETGNRRVTRLEPDGTTTVLADR